MVIFKGLVRIWTHTIEEKLLAKVWEEKEVGEENGGIQVVRLQSNISWLLGRYRLVVE